MSNRKATLMMVVSKLHFLNITSVVHLALRRGKLVPGLQRLRGSQVTEVVPCLVGAVYPVRFEAKAHGLSWIKSALEEWLCPEITGLWVTLQQVF